MADNVDIIKSKVVGSEHDVFWDVYHAENEPKSTLIISTAYQPGSADETQLQKMMQACTLGIEDYYVVKLGDQQQLAWHSIRDKIEPATVVLLGVPVQQLGVNVMLRFNEPNRFNGCVFIPTLALQELEKQPEVKKQLWLQALKPVFVDKTFQNHS